GDHLLLLAYGSGIQMWALIYLLALNLAFVFVRFTISFMATGASPRDGYLQYLLVRNEEGRNEKLLVPQDVMYIHSADGIQRVQTGDPARPPLEYGVSLDRTEARLNPLEYH